MPQTLEKPRELRSGIFAAIFAACALIPLPFVLLTEELTSKEFGMLAAFGLIGIACLVGALQLLFGVSRLVIDRESNTCHAKVGMFWTLPTEGSLDELSHLQIDHLEDRHRREPWPPEWWTVSVHFKNRSRAPISLSGEIITEEAARSEAHRFSELSELQVIEAQEREKVAPQADVSWEQTLDSIVRDYQRWQDQLDPSIGSRIELSRSDDELSVVSKNRAPWLWAIPGCLAVVAFVFLASGFQRDPTLSVLVITAVITLAHFLEMRIGYERIVVTPSRLLIETRGLLRTRRHDLPLRDVRRVFARDTKSLDLLLGRMLAAGIETDEEIVRLSRWPPAETQEWVVKAVRRLCCAAANA